MEILSAFNLTELLLNPKVSLTNENHFLDNLGAIATILAVFFGAIWFFRRRENKPRLNLKQNIKVLSSKNSHLIQVKLLICNVGKIKQNVKPSKGRHNLIILGKAPENDFAHQSKSKHEFHFEEVDRKEFDKEIHIEPGESAEVPFEFCVDKNVRIIKIYSFIENTQLYWWQKRSIPNLFVVNFYKYILGREIPSSKGWSVTTLKEVHDG